MGIFYKRKRPELLNTDFVLSRFSRLRDYQEFMHGGIEKGVLDFYQATYQRPVLGNRDFIE